MRLDEMDCADIMRKAVQRKRSRSIARRESFSGTEDDLKKFREAVQANEKDSDLQKDIEEYAVKVREIRGGQEEESAGVSKEQPEKPSSSAERVENKNTLLSQSNQPELAGDKTETSSNQISGSEKDTKELETKENDGKKIEATEDAEVVKEEGSSEENKDSIVPIVVEKQNVDSVEVEDKPITMTDDSGEGSEQATEITLLEEEQTNSVDVNLENETEEVAQECEQIGDADEIKDPNENENQTYQTEDISEKSEQIPDALTESEKVVDFDPGETKESCETQEVETPALVTDISENNNQQEAQYIEAEMKPEKGIDEDAFDNETNQGVLNSETKDIAEANEDELDNNPENEVIPEAVQDEVDNYHEAGSDEVNNDPETKVIPEADQDEVEAVKDGPENQDIPESVKDELDVDPVNKDIPEADKSDVNDDSNNKNIPETAKDEVDDDPKNKVISEPVEEKIKEDESDKKIIDVSECDGSNFLSIVDRIKNDITTLRTISKEGAKTAVNILREVDTEDTQDSQNSAELQAAVEKEEHDQVAGNNLKKIPSDHKQSGLKVALDRVSREKSASHVQIPQELSSHLISLSSANISEQLRKSCSNIVARLVQKPA